MAKRVNTAACERDWRADDIDRCSGHHELETMPFDESSIQPRIYANVFVQALREPERQYRGIW